MNFAFKEKKTGELFVAHAMITEEQLNNALEKADCRLGEWLLKHKLIDDTQFAKVLAEHFHADFVDLHEHNVDTTLFEILPVEHALYHAVLPYKLVGDTLYVAAAGFDDYMLEQKIETITNKKIKILFSSKKSIQGALNRSGGSEHVLNNATQEFKTTLIKETADGTVNEISLDQLGGDAAPMIRLINSIILDALKKRASDIHIEVYAKRIDVKYRVDGVLYSSVETLDPKYHSFLITRLKVMAELDIAEKKLPQDGRFKLRVGKNDIDFRISILPTMYGEDVVIRILDKLPFKEGAKKLTLKALGINEETLGRFRKAIREPYGMVLITGPTGSGKTTTLYAALTELYNGQEKIITIEDPIEYELDGIVQIPVNYKKDLTFAKGLRSILRHDPDKIMIGEIRDTETARIAVQSALTGHLVFTTVHANNTFDVISRFTHMGIDIYSFISALNCVMAQRLVRKVCMHCRVEKTQTPEYLHYSGLSDKDYHGHNWISGQGCDKCNHTGYYGRMAVTEFLPISPVIRELIIKQAGFTELLCAAKENGMKTLRENALQCALEGATTLEEINRVTFVD